MFSLVYVFAWSFHLKNLSTCPVDNLYSSLVVLMMCRFLWWRKNLKKILLLKMRTGTDSFLNIRSMHLHNDIFHSHLSNHSYLLLLLYLLYFCCWITWIISGRLWNKRRSRVKRRNKTHHSLLLNNLAWWDHFFDFQYIFALLCFPKYFCIALPYNMSLHAWFIYFQGIE